MAPSSSGQDAALSRLKHGFDSRRGHQWNQALSLPGQPTALRAATNPRSPSENLPALPGYAMHRVKFGWQPDRQIPGALGPMFRTPAGMIPRLSAVTKAIAPKDDAWSVGDYDRPVAFLAQEAIGNPQGAVHECRQRLNQRSLLALQVKTNLVEVGHIHRNGRSRCNPAKDGQCPLAHHPVLRHHPLPVDARSHRHPQPIRNCPFGLVSADAPLRNARAAPCGHG